MPDSKSGATRTRRQFLRRAGGTALVGSAAVGASFSNTAAGQALVSRQMAFRDIPDAQIESNSHYVVLADRVQDQSQGIDPSTISGCNVAELPPEGMWTYEGVIVDRLSQSPQGFERQILVNEQEERIEAGSVFIISNAEQCSNGYVGVEVEAISQDTAPLGTDTAQPTDGGSGPIPGFQASGAVAALAGLLGFARWRGGDED